MGIAIERTLITPRPVSEHTSSSFSADLFKYVRSESLGSQVVAMVQAADMVRMRKLNRKIRIAAVLPREIACFFDPVRAGILSKRTPFQSRKYQI